MARCPTCHRRVAAGTPCAAHPGGPVAPVVVADAPAVAPAWPTPLGGCLGAGGFASVWEVAGGASVIKIAHAAHELSRARLVREAEALGAIGAPAVPALLGHGVLPDGRAWIEMGRISGVTLGDLVMRGAVTSERAVLHALALLDALAAVHAAGFVHRDLKPDNLVLGADGRVTILDLGLARRWPTDGADPTRAGIQVGSLEYMPPEQLLDASAVDPRADLYAFGCVLYELIAGRPPFVGEPSRLERAHAALRPTPLSAHASVPVALEAAVHECLAKLPDRRPASATALRARLLALQTTAPALSRAVPSMSVVGEGAQPVVLLWAELPRVDRALLGLLGAHKVTVVSQRGRRVLGAVLGADHADPAGDAIAAARDLAAAGARVALHLDALQVSTRATGTSLTGESAERPEAWLPPGAWTGVVLTRSLAAVAQVPARPSELPPGFVLLGDPGDSNELVGREGPIAALVADAEIALGAAGAAAAGPAFAVMIGDLAVGKSAVAAAVADRLRAAGVHVHVAAIPPPGSGRAAVSALAELVAPAAGPVVRAIGDALRAAARARPLVVILDDLHLADHELYDALEYATLGGEALPLWVLGVGSPRLEQRRPGLGARAERHRREVLPPLDDEAAIALTAALLRPAEYPPVRALRQIAALARGNPLHLRALARDIHERGAIRTRASGEHFLDTTALDALPPLALGPWLAARELASLPEELVALARVCAMLGEELERDEVAAVVEAVEARGGATTPIDVDVGLSELASAGILTGAAPHWAFRTALLHEGIDATTEPASRRALHQAALEYWQARAEAGGAAARIAGHAEEVGDRATAAAAFAVLGERAHGANRALEADQAWNGALRNLEAAGATPGLATARALLGRARARYRLQRVREAAVDLAQCVEVARACGDRALELEGILELATTLDWSEEFERSRELADEAAALHAALVAHPPGPPLAPGLDVDVTLARARSLFRAQRLPEAMEGFREVLAHGRPEARTIAGLLLGPCLVDIQALDEAEGVFAQLIELCERADDRFHLTGAYVNRAWLWSARGRVEHADDDLRRVIQLAREGGYAYLERVGTYNLAEARLWEGALDDALALAQRSHALQRAHGEASARLDALLLARVAAARGDIADLQRLLASLAGEPFGADEQPIVAVLEALATDAPPAVWERALASLDRLLTLGRLELMLLASRHGSLSAVDREVARALAQGDPIWSRRLDQL